MTNPTRIHTLSFLDHVLGGGFVPGTVTVVSGAPGVGKTRLLMQAASALGRKAAFVGNEESFKSILVSAKKMSFSDFMLFRSEYLDDIFEEVHSYPHSLSLLVVDSLHGLVERSRSTGARFDRGSVDALKTSIARLATFALERGVAVAVTAHVGADDEVSLPREVEHLVDTVLVLEHEQEEGGAERVLRVRKSRYGDSSLHARLKMTDAGLVSLVEVDDAELRPEAVYRSVSLMIQEDLLAKLRRDSSDCDQDLILKVLREEVQRRGTSPATSATNETDAPGALIDRLEFRFVRFGCADLELRVILRNNYAFELPLARLEKLRAATYDQLHAYELVAGGLGVRWPQLDEDLSLRGLLQTAREYLLAIEHEVSSSCRVVRAPDTRTVRDVLALADRDASLAEIDEWTREQRREAFDWAAAAHLAASDNDVAVPPVPAHVAALPTMLTDGVWPKSRYESRRDTYKDADEEGPGTFNNHYVDEHRDKFELPAKSTKENR